MEITATQRRTLRARAHTLHPVVSISQHGLSETVLAEIDRCLTSHELIKVRVYGEERPIREAILAEICSKLDAAAVQHIGHLLVIFRPTTEEYRLAAKGAHKPGRITKKPPRLTKAQAGGDQSKNPDAQRRLKANTKPRTKVDPNARPERLFGTHRFNTTAANPRRRTRG